MPGGQTNSLEPRGLETIPAPAVSKLNIPDIIVTNDKRRKDTHG
jgi:hypothetical protein